MRFFHIHDQFTELPGWPASLPTHGFLWVTTSRRVFEVQLAQVQQHLQRLAGGSLLDLHVSDLLNPQLPSQYDYTSWYDLLVFRRLAAAGPAAAEDGELLSVDALLQRIDTNPVGFALFDHVLITVHPDDCLVRDQFAERLARE